MKENRMNFCPECGSDKIETHMMGRKWKCPQCGFELYNNVASAVGVVIFDGDGNVLLEKRAKEPRKGYLAFPGGFVDPDESLEEAAVRECMEEIGIKPNHVEFAASFPNTYEYKSVVYKTCDVFFTAAIDADAKFSCQQSEVQDIVWVPCRTMEELEKIPLAFDSARKTLEKLLDCKAPRLH